MVNVRLCEKVSLAFLVLKASIRGSHSKTFQHLWQKLTNKSDFETFLAGKKKLRLQDSFVKDRECKMCITTKEIRLQGL